MAPLKLIVEINAMGQALDKQDAYQLGLNDLEVASTWMELLVPDETDQVKNEEQVTVNPYYFRGKCPWLQKQYTSAFSDKPSAAKPKAIPSSEEAKCPALMSFQLADRAENYLDESHFFFYTTPYVNETNLVEKVSQDQWKSLKLCIEADNILTNFLDNEYGELTKAATLVGFKNNAFCYHPAQNKCYFE